MISALKCGITPLLVNYEVSDAKIKIRSFMQPVSANPIYDIESGHGPVENKVIHNGIFLLHSCIQYFIFINANAVFL
jgi:hypothetical protein